MKIKNFEGGMSVKDFKDFRGNGKPNGKILKKGNFVPIEDVAEELPDDEEELGLEEEENEAGGLMNEGDFAEKEKEHLKNMSRESGFVQGKGVAHVGPEFSELETAQDSGQVENISPEEEINESHISISRDLIRNNHSDHDIRRDVRNTGMEHDNLKTIKNIKDKFGEPSKLQRMLRKTIGKFYDRQKEDEKPSWEDTLDDQKN